MEANQLPCLKSGRPEIWVDWLMTRKLTSVRPRRKKRKASVTMKLESFERTTMLPISQPRHNVMMMVTRKAIIGLACPRPNGKPHLSIIAIDMPAKPIIEPIERSNSPAIISRLAPVAMIPNCAITDRLFFSPRGLNAFPSLATPIAITTKTMTRNTPTSGRRLRAKSHPPVLRRSASARPAKLEDAWTMPHSSPCGEADARPLPRSVPVCERRLGQRVTPANLATLSAFDLSTKPGPEGILPNGNMWALTL